ncbi:MAG: UDP-N-acetylmuramate--L-alanine ligase [Bacteroidales bacterium]|nr:UDP-N-acetylmuramate--L-alanine ligase [Bacteroidales bacterium]
MTNKPTYYFLGIGGIGMSALARYFHAKGCTVLGYDRTRTPLTEELEHEGIAIHYAAHNLSHADLKPTNTIVVYTPAIPADFEEFVYFKTNNFSMLKRAQVLGEITRHAKGMCIAGTHGKTTTSTMTAHLLYSSHVGCSAFLGGVSKNYGTNLLLPRSNSDFVVIEADEYDRSFHHLSPYMALISSIDADHLDIYADKDDFRRSFEHFASLVQEGGCLVVKHGLQLQLPAHIQSYSYGMNEGDFHAENIRIENGEISFDFVTPHEIVKNIQLGVPVLINVENAVGAMALAHTAGVSPEELHSGIASFKGIKRRFDIQLKAEKLVYIDDYAHHPEELKASILSIKALYPNRTVCGIFQPHLYSRTRDFAQEFGTSLSLLDEVVLLDIYPARELPIAGVSSDLIFKNISISHKIQLHKNEVIEFLKQKTNIDILVTFGAGDIDQLVVPITQELRNKC